MKGIYASPTRLNILSCAVAGRPGHSAYESAAEAGYTGTPEEFDALLAGLPATLLRLNVYNGRVDALLEYLENRVTDLELAVAALQAQASNQSSAVPLRREASPDASAPAGGIV